jgi:hypothetical protein
MALLDRVAPAPNSRTMVGGCGVMPLANIAMLPWLLAPTTVMLTEMLSAAAGISQRPSDRPAISIVRAPPLASAGASAASRLSKMRQGGSTVK